MVTSIFLDRREAISVLLQDREDLLVITGLGSPSYDVHAAGDRPENYYLWGAMGSAALVGLGLALAQPEEKIVVVTGDGEQLMGLGGLATIGIAAPRNLSIIVIDNGRFGETGMQLSHTGAGLELDRVAAACGFAETSVARVIGDVERIRKNIHVGQSGPNFHVIKVKAEAPPRSLPPRDAVYVKNRFRQHQGLRVT